MKVHARVVAVESIVGHHFSDERLAISAITHPSAAEGRPISCCYERLEFLGDSVLGEIVANYAYEMFPLMNEGELTLVKTSLVSGEMLSKVAADLGLTSLIIMGDSERGTHARGMHKALEDVFEALVGALYLDGGIEAARTFVTEVLLLPYADASLAARPLSAKSRLQEVLQRDLRVGPTYTIVDQTGPAHTPTFTAVALVEGRRIGRGQGSSKKEAETEAATDALINLGYLVEADTVAVARERR